MDSSLPISEPRLEQRPRPWVTWGIVGSTVLVFLLQLYGVHYHHGRDRVGDTLAFSSQALSDHRYWTLITYAWAHATFIFGDPGLFWLHIMANMIPVYCLGPLLEEFLGRGHYLVLYLGGAVFSALAWLLCNHSDPDQSIIGASGAVFALIAAAGTAAPRARVDVYILYVLPVRMNLMALALVACGVEVAQIIFGWMSEVAHSAHLGGAIFGFFYILLLRFFSRKSLHV